MNEWANQRQSLLQNLRRSSSQRDDATETGFGENWQAALATTIDQDLSISRYIANAPKRDRNSKLTTAIQNGEIPPSIVDQYRNKTRRGTKVDWDGLSKWSNDNGGDFRTDEELDETVKSEILARDRMARDIHERQGGAGMLGEFAGGMHAALAFDPINMVASIPSAGMGATIWQTAKRAAVVGASTNVLAETAIQPLVYDWKKDLGIDYTFADAATNVALSGIMGGAISGAAGGLGHWARNARGMANKAEKAGDMDEAEALHQSADIAEQMEIEAKNVPQGDLTPQAADKIISERYIRVAEGVYDTNAGIEARAELEGWSNGLADFDQKIADLDASTGRYIEVQPGIYEYAPTIKVAAEIKPGVYAMMPKQEALAMEKAKLEAEKPKPKEPTTPEAEVKESIAPEQGAEIVPMSKKAKEAWDKDTELEMNRHKELMNQEMADGKTFADGINSRAVRMDKLKKFQACVRGE